MSTERRHVLVLSQNFPPDKMGNASRVYDNARHLAEEDWEVTVVAPPPAFPYGRFEQSWKRKKTTRVNGVTVHRLWAWQPTSEDPSFLARIAYYLTFPIHAMLWMLFNYSRYDAVFTTSPPIFVGGTGFLFKLLSGGPWVLDVRDLWIDASLELGFISEGVIEKLSRLYQRTMLSAADKVSVTTTELERRLVDTYRIDPSKVFHLPNGVDSDLFSPGSENGGSPVIIYTGNLGYAQDLQCCIRAMREVDVEDATLMIVGDGDTKSELEALTDRLELDDRVEFTGLVDREDVSRLHEEAAVGVAPLKSDSGVEYAVPTKAYEYMASGLPVVATGRGEIERFVDESGGGVVVDNDPTELARSIEELLTTPSLRDRYGREGREHVERNYTRESIATRLGKELRSLF